MGLTISLLSFTPAGLCVQKCFCSSTPNLSTRKGNPRWNNTQLDSIEMLPPAEHKKNGAETWAYCSTKILGHKNTSERECFAFAARVNSIVKRVSNKLKAPLHVVTSIYMLTIVKHINRFQLTFKSAETQELGGRIQFPVMSNLADTLPCKSFSFFPVSN